VSNESSEHVSDTNGWRSVVDEDMASFDEVQNSNGDAEPAADDLTGLPRWSQDDESPTGWADPLDRMTAPTTPPAAVTTEAAPAAPETPDAPEAPVAPAAAPSFPASATESPKFVSEELAPILQAAEAAAQQMVERARASTEARTVEAERRWNEVQVQVAALNDWRDRVEPGLRELQAAMTDVRTEMQQVPDRIREALDPIARAIAALDPVINDVNSASGHPLEMGRIE
jgi:hypothetical protein